MISHVTSPTQTQPAAQANVDVKTGAKAKTQPPANGAAATVQISNAAQAALEEATETSAVTAKEAMAGDRQAQKLLAKEAAAKAVQK